MTLPGRVAAASLWGRTYRKRTGVGLLRDLEVTRWRHGTVAFILGSGPSINDLTSSQWREIRAGTSIGFNRWLEHEHVPDLYVFENITEDRRTQLIARSDAYQNTPMILKQHLANFSPRQHRHRQRALSCLPTPLRKNIYMSSDLIVPGRTERSVNFGFRLVAKLGLFRQSPHYQWLPKRTGSLIFLIALCVRSGFRNIVLCGVDLNRSGTFFDPPRDECDTRQVHDTEDPTKKILPISVVLRLMSTAVLEPRGVSLRVGHPSSALAAWMPVHAWGTSPEHVEE